jgi:hypothetical protein
VSLASNDRNLWIQNTGIERGRQRQSQESSHRQILRADDLRLSDPQRLPRPTNRTRRAAGAPRCRVTMLASARTLLAGACLSVSIEV